VLNSFRIATALAVDEMAESLSFVVGKRVGARLGTSVAFRIEGTSARRLDVVVEGRARLVSHAVARPTATLTLDAGTLGALFSSRVAVHSVLESGRLSLDGDVALARAVAENLGFVL
jgi:ubiquinone biosynthesis protein UbiJ